MELVFPESITVGELPAVPGWTATVVGGKVGGPATGATWQGGPQPDDVELPIKLGPLPDEPGRLQFKVVQTYDNGEVGRWIDEWPEGAPEPESPGPVLELAQGAPGVVPATTAPEAATTTEAPTTATTAVGDKAAADQADDDSDTNPLVWIIPIVVVLGAAGGGYAYVRSRRSTGTPS